MQEEFSDFIRFLANRAYRLISICPVALNILSDLIQSSGADALEDELRSQASACFTRIPPTYGGPLLMKNSGAGGSRTRVQKLIHYSFFHHSQCFNIPSAYRPLTCYRPQQLHGFSYIAKLRCRSLPKIDAIPKGSAFLKDDDCPQAAYAKLSLAFIFFPAFSVALVHGWLPQLQNPCRNQSTPDHRSVITNHL